MEKDELNAIAYNAIDKIINKQPHLEVIILLRDKRFDTEINAIVATNGGDQVFTIQMLVECAKQIAKATGGVDVDVRHKVDPRCN